MYAEGVASRSCIHLKWDLDRAFGNARLVGFPVCTRLIGPTVFLIQIERISPLAVDPVACFE